MAIGDGFKIGYRQSLCGAGHGHRDRLGRAHDRPDGRAARRPADPPHLGDAGAIRSECFLVRRCHPELDRRWGGQPAQRGPLLHPRRGPGVPGDPLHDARERTPVQRPATREARRVCHPGDEVKKQLFADRPAVGAAGAHPGHSLHRHRRTGEERPEQLVQRLRWQKVVVPLHRPWRERFPDPRPFVGVGSHRQHHLHAAFGGRTRGGLGPGEGLARAPARVRSRRTRARCGSGTRCSSARMVSGIYESHADLSGLRGRGHAGPGWPRGHEHHAGGGGRTDARDRHQEGRGRHARCGSWPSSSSRRCS